MEPTSSKEPKRRPQPPGRPSGDEFFAQQITEARSALESTLNDLKLDVARAADLRRWVRRYPWAALGTAFVAGFSLPLVVRAARRRSVDDDVEQRTPDSPDEHAARQTHKPARRAAEGSTWQSALLAGLFDILRLAVTQVISASVRQAASSQAEFRSAAPGDVHNPSPSTSRNDDQATGPPGEGPSAPLPPQAPPPANP